MIRLSNILFVLLLSLPSSALLSGEIDEPNFLANSSQVVDVLYPYVKAIGIATLTAVAHELGHALMAKWLLYY